MTPETLAAELEAELRSAAFGQGDASHDIHHCRRVLATARALAAEEGGDLLVLTAAAYLHDFVNLPKTHPDRASASRRSAEAAGPILTALGLPDPLIAAACHAIEAHSFSAGLTPETVEAKVLQDADRLEALGAIGIARTFCIAGQIGVPLFDGDDPFADQRAPDDRRFALDHFAVKLLGLADTMQTEAGRRRAELRTEVMRQFLDQLRAELSGQV